MIFDADFFEFDSNESPQTQYSALMQYLRQQKPEILAKVAQSASPEIKEIISQNVKGLVGMLPTENYTVQVTTDRDNLANLLASAMMTGYFLRQMEQRMNLETMLWEEESE
ncbi:MAG: DUF760 domain-containing protein [Cyanobacteria bacterium J083]|nr:MAG: DUF760 domain-containing protein [Cyanobacteria bacterium J083]